MSGIYIHIPFCKQACHYCDFHFSTSLKKKEELIEALILELEIRKNEFKNTPEFSVVNTIYFGGGTPSLLSSFELKRIIDAIYKNYNVSEHAEITLEANPDDLVTDRALSRTIFKDYVSIGINRLSIGIQSFHEKDLKLMNRAHNTYEAKKCLETATQYFNNISLDLIYGIPNSTSKEWEENINLALGFGVNHISSYALTVEPKTALALLIKKGIVNSVDDDLAQEQFYILIHKLEANNYVHYELSNFGKEGFFSKNNSAYWQGKRYMGIGPSAHSFNGKERGWNVSNNTKYIQSIKKNKLPMEIETLTLTDRYNEYIMTGLRTIWGVSIQKIRTDYGIAFENYLLKQAQKYINEHVLIIEDKKLKVSKKGLFLSDGIASDLFMLK